jgi:hypothetical protein
MEKQTTRIMAFLGQSVIAGMITGIAGLVAAVFAFIGGDWTGTGVCLIAAALSFGMLANAMLRE